MNKSEKEKMVPVWMKTCLTLEEAERKIVEYIELYYNSERLHSGINYSIPNQFFTLLSVRNS